MGSRGLRDGQAQWKRWRPPAPASVPERGSGILVTSACLDARAVAKSVFRVLRDYVPAFSPIQDTHDTLEAELVALAETEKRFFTVPTGVRGLVFVGWERTPSLPNPNAVLDTLRTALADSRSFYRLSRIYPVADVTSYRTLDLKKGARSVITTYLKSLEQANPDLKARCMEDRPFLINVAAHVRNNTDCSPGSVVTAVGEAAVEAAQAIGWSVAVMPAASDVFVIVHICQTTAFHTVYRDDCRVSYASASAASVN